MDAHISKLRSAISGKNVLITDSESSDSSDSESLLEPAPAPARKHQKQKTFSQNPALAPEEQNSEGGYQLPPAPVPVLLPSQYEVLLSFSVNSS